MRQPKHLFSLLGLAILALALVGPRSAMGDDFVVVANPRVSTTSLTHDAAQQLFSGRATNWPDGTPVVLVLPPRGSASMRWLSSSLLGMPEAAYRRFVLNQVFRGRARRPLEPRTTRSVGVMVRQTRGALGVVPRSEAEGLRVIQITGES